MKWIVHRRKQGQAVRVRVGGVDAWVRVNEIHKGHVVLAFGRGDGLDVLVTREETLPPAETLPAYEEDI